METAECESRQNPDSGLFVWSVREGNSDSDIERYTHTV